MKGSNDVIWHWKFKDHGEGVFEVELVANTRWVKHERELIFLILGI